MTSEELTAKLAEPFDPSEIKWKAQVVRGNRAMAVPYVDARVVEDRLDAVFGVDGWQDTYTVLDNHSVVCTLRVRVGQEWIAKTDVGSQSEQPDEGDRLKAAFSDALKRAAVKLGIGRYLYRLGHQWVDYDPQTRQFKGTPRLPDSALPKGKGKAPAKPEPSKSAANGSADAPPSGKITREQWDEIKSALARSNIKQSVMLAHFGYERGSDIPEGDFHNVLEAAQKPPRALIERAKQMATEEAKKQPTL